MSFAYYSEPWETDGLSVGIGDGQDGIESVLVVVGSDKVTPVGTYLNRSQVVELIEELKGCVEVFDENY